MKVCEQILKRQSPNTILILWIVTRRPIIASAIVLRLLKNFLANLLSEAIFENFGIGFFKLNLSPLVLFYISIFWCFLLYFACQNFIQPIRLVIVFRILLILILQPLLPTVRIFRTHYLRNSVLSIFIFFKHLEFLKLCSRILVFGN